MVQFIGVILLVASGGLLGVTAAGKLKSRERALLELKQLVQRLKTAIAYGNDALPQLIEELQEFSLCQQALHFPGFSFHPLEALEKAGSTLPIDAGDREWLKGFTAGLGTSDLQGQMEHLTLQSVLLEERLQEARDNVHTKTKLYLALGFFASLALCAVLL